MELPIFPLNGAVLFPGTSLPLNIFENRYIEMVNYCLARDRQIGMIQTNENNEIYKVGCMGKIQSFNETNDGRYLISLKGISCFNVVNELSVDFSFRIVNASIIESYEEKNSLNNNDKLKILEKYEKYIRAKNIDLDLSEIDKIEIDQIMKFIAMVSPFKSIEKQVLLETKELGDFYNKLVSIIELEVANEFTNKTLN